MILVGEEGTKRTEFMRRAARETGVELSLLSWSHSFSPEQLEGKRAVVKLDPPSYSGSILEQGEREIKDHLRLLERLEQSGSHFLNEPATVRMLLDKRLSKQRLQEQGIPVTQLFAEEFSCAEELLRWMESEHVSAVFVKPRFFSGAAGVLAFRYQRSGGRMVAYTSCRLEDGRLINTKHLFCLRRREEILPVLNRLLALDCVVERWHSKETAGGKGVCYDLRVVWQFGHAAFWVARGAKGPITNLHLNNRALSMDEIGLAGEKRQEIEDLCRSAVSCFAGLRVVGLDIMLERGSGRPLLIEMNGQGDLIYQDIYGENRIYREQCEWQKDFCGDSRPVRTV